MDKIRYMMRRLFLIGIFLCSLLSLSARETYAYAERDTTLRLDVYRPETANGYTVVHVFGGGYLMGYRQNAWDSAWCAQLADLGYTAVAIDYRLGLKGIEMKKIRVETLVHCIYMAAEDCCAAVAWLVGHAEELGIDGDKIILEGSSAGAITALMTDYGRCNRLDYASVLPAGWRPAGVVSFSGAVYSEQGRVQWRYDKPAPTMMVHGTEDGIVTYNKVEFGKLGWYGSSSLVKRFAHYGYPYCIYRMTGQAHEACVGAPLLTYELNSFVHQYVEEGRQRAMDVTLQDSAIAPEPFHINSTKLLYKHKRL